MAKFPAAVSLAAILGAALPTACGAPPVEFTTGRSLEGVTVIDPVTGRTTPNMTIVIQGNRIAAVEPRSRIVLGEGVERVDGDRRFVIPGLWDMHVHAAQPGGEAALPLFVANGVTGVREMWGNLEAAREMRRAIADGEYAGPRMVVAGNLVDGANPWWPGSNVATTPAEGRALVDSLAAAGAAFIKVYSVLRPDVFRAIVEQAAVAGLPVAGHVPFSVSAAEASERGQKSMAHLMGVVEGCSSVDDEVRAVRADWLADRADGRNPRNPFFDPGLYRQLSDAYDPTRCGALLDRLATNGTWLNPTLTVLRGVALAGDSAFMADPRLKYVPPPMRTMWVQGGRMLAPTNDADRTARRQFFQRQMDIVGMAAERGVPILAGTDTPNPFVFQGFSLHDELELLVEAGLSNLQALQSATLGPAMYFEARDSLGTVEPGKVADLVVLEANPLEDIGHTRGITAVVANGRYYDRAALDRVLADAEEATTR